MKLMRHLVAGLVVFAVLVICCVNIYSGYQDGYSLVDGDIKTLNETTGNVMTQLQSLTIVEGINSISEGMVNLEPGSASLYDLVGGLATVAVGVLKTALGALVFPFQITNKITAFYFGDIPSGIITGLLVLITIYAGFIMVSAYLKHDV